MKFTSVLVIFACVALQLSQSAPAPEDEKTEVTAPAIPSTAVAVAAVEDVPKQSSLFPEVKVESEAPTSSAVVQVKEVATTEAKTQ